ncbi:Periplasmic nitrate reductase [Streptomyces microflavus]
MAGRLRAIVDEHETDALALYVSGQMSLEAQYLANKLAKGFVRTSRIESNSRLCMASAGSGYKLSLGADGPPGSYRDFDRADVCDQHDIRDGSVGGRRTGGHVLPYRRRTSSGERRRTRL